MTVIEPGLYVDANATAQLAAYSSVSRKAIFLDRDGVINVDRAYVHSQKDTEWIDGIFEFCRSAADAGFLLIVVTNQAGIARGYYSEVEFLEYTRWVHGEFSRRGTPLLATYYCPHHPDAGNGVLRVVCGCRKPAPGMILSAAARFDVVLTQSVLIGNNLSDVEAGQAAGIRLCGLLDESSEEKAVSGVLRSRSLQAMRQLL